MLEDTAQTEPAEPDAEPAAESGISPVDALVAEAFADLKAPAVEKPEEKQPSADIAQQQPATEPSVDAELAEQKADEPVEENAAPQPDPSAAAPAEEKESVAVTESPEYVKLRDDHTEFMRHTQPILNALSDASKRLAAVGLGPSYLDAATDLMIRAEEDPVAAFQDVSKWYHSIALRAGQLLPDDLAAQVHQGQLTSNAAASEQQMRARQQLEQRVAAFNAQRQQAAAPSAPSGPDLAAVGQKLRGLEGELARDPAYGVLRDALYRELKAARDKGLISPDTAVPYVRDVFDKLKAERRNKPSRKPVTAARGASADAPKTPAELLVSAAFSTPD